MDCDELRLLGRLCSHFFLLFFFFSHLSGFGAYFHLLNGNFVWTCAEFYTDVVGGLPGFPHLSKNSLLFPRSLASVRGAIVLKMPY